GERRDVDAKMLETVCRVLVELGGVEQRLGRDAADIEARAAKGRPFLDHGHLHAELGGADRRDIPSRPRTDDGKIEYICHNEPLDTGPGECDRQFLCRISNRVSLSRPRAKSPSHNILPEKALLSRRRQPQTQTITPKNSSARPSAATLQARLRR